MRLFPYFLRHVVNTPNAAVERCPKGIRLKLLVLPERSEGKQGVPLNCRILPERSEGRTIRASPAGDSPAGGAVLKRAAARAGAQMNGFLSSGKRPPGASAGLGRTHS
jgi:hypothetical protein